MPLIETTTAYPRLSATAAHSASRHSSPIPEGVASQGNPDTTLNTAVINREAPLTSSLRTRIFDAALTALSAATWRYSSTKPFIGEVSIEHKPDGRLAELHLEMIRGQRSAFGLTRELLSSFDSVVALLEEKQLYGKTPSRQARQLLENVLVRGFARQGLQIREFFEGECRIIRAGRYELRFEPFTPNPLENLGYKLHELAGWYRRSDTPMAFTLRDCEQPPRNFEFSRIWLADKVKLVLDMGMVATALALIL